MSLMRPPCIIDDPTFNDRANRLIATNGDNERAGVSLEEIADMIYTRRLRINPEVGAAAAAGKQAKSTKKEKITGEKMDDLLG